MTKILAPALHCNSIVNTVINALLIVGSVALCVAMQPYGLSYVCNDESYQYLSVLHYKESPVAPLSFYIGHLWSLLFGHTVLSMRMLQVVMQIAAIGLGAVYFYRRTRDSRVASVLFATLLTASKFWSMNIYGWDVGSYPFIMLCLLAAIRYYHRPTMTAVLFLAFSFALMCLSRVTLLAGLPFVAGLVVWRCRGRVRACVAQLLCAAVLGLIIVAAVLSLIYGSVGAYTDVCIPDNIVNGHIGKSALLRFYSRLYFTTLEVAGGWTIGVSALVCTYFIVKAKRWKSAIWIMAVLVLALTAFAMQAICAYTYVFGALHPVFFFLCFFGVYKAGVSGSKVNMPFENVIVLVFALLPLVGSDSFLVRVLVLPVLPVVCATDYMRLRHIVRPLAFVLLAGIAICALRQMRGWHTVHTCDGALIASRMAGMKIEEFSKADFQPYPLEIKDKYFPEGKVKIIDDNNLAYAYFVDEELSLSRQLFSFYVFEEDRPLYDRCVAEGYNFIVGTLRPEYRRPLEDYLFAQGYECISVDDVHAVFRKR